MENRKQTPKTNRVGSLKYLKSCCQSQSATVGGRGTHFSARLPQLVGAGHSADHSADNGMNNVPVHYCICLGPTETETETETVEQIPMRVIGTARGCGFALLLIKRKLRLR